MELSGQAAVTDVSNLDRFDENPTGQYWMRHPTSQGRVLQDLARKHYVLAENVTVKFFAPSSTDPLLVRHKLNRDKQASTVQRYVRIILQKGVQKGARS